MERTDIEGNLQRLYWTTVTVVPTGDGLRPTRMAEKLNLPYFAKATQGL